MGALWGTVSQNWKALLDRHWQHSSLVRPACRTKELVTIVGDVALSPSTNIRLLSAALSPIGASRVSAKEWAHHHTQGAFSSQISKALAPPPTAVSLGWDVVTFQPGIGFDESWRTITGAKDLRVAPQAALNQNGLFRELTFAQRVAQMLEKSRLEPDLLVPVQVYELTIPTGLTVRNS